MTLASPETPVPRASLALRSMVDPAGTLRLSLDSVPIAAPGPGEVVVQMEAAPVHPADIMVLFAGADLGSSREDGLSALVAPMSQSARSAAAARIGMSMDVGLEGAGTVVASGEGAEPLAGARVALLAPSLGTYAEYCKVPAASCMILPERIGFKQGAAAFTNPLTALAMVETLHQTGEKAMVHTAAASTIGQMLVRICAEDGIELVNIVRSEDQVELLRASGAKYVCNSSAPDYAEQLAHALGETGAKVAFDAIGGGDTASTLLVAMETAAAARMDGFNAYGSSEMKRIYVYGRFDSSPTTIPRGAYGMLWSVEGWAMPPILERAGEVRKAELIRRISDGLDSTFACVFGAEITLAQLLDPGVARGFARQRTGGKVLVVMNRSEQR